jgi:cytochrome c oxidase subunit 2
MVNKILMGILLSIVLIVSGCTGSAPESQSTQDIQEEGASVSDSPSEESDSTGEVKEFSLTVKKFSFTPGEITVKKGDTVRLTITSEDTSHGFSLPDFDVNEQIPSGESVSIEFIADKSGEFTFRCSVFCGSGHGSMSGTLIVQD